MDPTFRSADVLAIIVAIRTFLSFSLEVQGSLALAVPSTCCCTGADGDR